MSCSRTQRVSRIRISVLGMLLLEMALPLFGQRPSRPGDTLVPPLVSFGGSLTDSNGKALNGVVGVTFALYKEPQGGAPLWLETQNVTADKTGRYAVQLGSTSANGLPPDLFPTGEERWLAVQVIGQPEQARILLVSVPYALKAGDAAALGGLPASAFALAGQQSPGKSPSGPAKSGNVATSPAAGGVSGSGTPGYVPRWTGSSSPSTTLGNSLIFQTATGRIGLGTTAPAAKLDASGGTDVGLRGTTTGSNAGAVWGDAISGTGVTVGVRGTSASTAGTGVSGNAIATSGANIGVAGHSASAAGTGAIGSADSTSGATVGILGRVASSAGTAGIFNNAAGGKELSAQAKGIENFSVDGHGDVKGAAATFTAVGPITAGVTAKGAQTQTSSPVGDGVDAYGGLAVGGNGGVGVKAAGGSGLIGGAGLLAGGGGAIDGGDAGAGISATGGSAGASTGGDGIDAFAGMGGAGSGFAGSFTGDVAITGSLSVSGTKHFRIDDPLDPANKYLYHAALESSEVLDLYSGNARFWTRTAWPLFGSPNGSRLLTQISAIS